MAGVATKVLPGSQPCQELKELVKRAAVKQLGAVTTATLPGMLGACKFLSSSQNKRVH